MEENNTGDEDRVLDFFMTPSKEKYRKGKERRLENLKNKLSFGVTFLDNALGGIRPNDLILIGARSGVGKTEIATHIAKQNIKNGKRVHFFALEAEDNEIEDRIRYKEMANLFFKDPYRPNVKLSYSNWIEGHLEGHIDKYEDQAIKELENSPEKLSSFYRTNAGDFTIKEFERYLMAIKSQSDLVIIDHLNYFDYDEKMAETVAVTQIVKKIRDLALLTGLPIILISHLRKRDRFDKGIVPDLEDFFGSSNVYKIATKAILLAPSSDNPDSHRWSTYMRIGKNRIEGSATRFIAKCTFNSRENKYEPEYKLAKWKPGIEEFIPIDNVNDLPDWQR